MSIPVWNFDYFDDKIWYADDTEDAEYAVNKLWDVPVSAGQQSLSVHLEGVSVGSLFGRATLLTFGSRFDVCDDCSVVMFDVQACPDIWDEVTELLESADIRKVFHSSIGDLFAMQAQHGIDVDNAYDIAVADYVIDWQADPRLVPGYRSLNALAEDYGYGKVPLNYPIEDVASSYRHGHQVWADRPLDATMRAFAASDVYNMIVLYDKMRSLVSRDVGRQMMDKIMWERLNLVYDPDAVRQSQDERERARYRGSYF